MVKSFICQQCGKEFVSKKACKNRIPKYCSSKCYGLSIAKVKTCKQCGKEFYNWQNKMFCSMECSGKSRQGKQLSASHRKKLSEARIGKFANENHPQWKGDDVGYGALHDWVYKELGSPMVCEKCGKTKTSNRNIHWANKSGEYKRDKDDWIRLCVSCHKKMDLGRS